MYEVETFKRMYPEWFHPTDIKHVVIWFIIFIVFVLVIYYSPSRINKEIKKIINRKFKEKVEDSLISEYEFIYGERINWTDEIKQEFDKKWEDIQEKYKTET